MSTSEIITFGCRLNSFESEVMRGHMAAAGLDDVVVVHTCAVTAEAERQARQAIRKAKRANPDKRVVVTGCAAQIHREAFDGMDEVAHVLGNEDKLDAATWQALRQRDAERLIVSDVMQAREIAGHLVEGFDGHSRAFLQVQQGCDHRCTFCIIPFGRGNSRSVPVGGVVAQASALVAAGYNEIVITGVDITSYGKDLPGTPTLGNLCRRLLALVPELARLRLSSIDPAEIDDDLLYLIEHEPRLMPHLHLSVQAGDDLILKRMKRRHGRAEVIALCARLRALRPDIVFGADLIAGFPTETEAMAQASCDLVDEAGLTFLHVFPFSARAGTPAARMPQVPKELRKQRAAALRAKGDHAVRGLHEREQGQRRQIVIEQGDKGHSEHFALVQLERPAPKPAGALLDVRITGQGDGHLIGVAA
ncbi:MAG: tRNA (N(6)-L-threonylcarbamoyladenosine(37)-C(2))-methylthiotransferase MtaB [Geminicoccaceae bacterium]